MIALNYVVTVNGMADTVTGDDFAQALENQVQAQRHWPGAAVQIEVVPNARRVLVEAGVWWPDLEPACRCGGHPVVLAEAPMRGGFAPDFTVACRGCHHVTVPCRELAEAWGEWFDHVRRQAA